MYMYVYIMYIIYIYIYIYIYNKIKKWRQNTDRYVSDFKHLVKDTNVSELYY